MRSPAERDAIIIAGVAVTLAGCSAPEMVEDVQGNTVTSFEAAVDAFCQQDEGLAFGSAEYEACRKYVSDYARRVVLKGSI